ncbi:iron-containing alcohol dehydrogenase [Paenibacillus sp. GSMTC-2017]|uniref:iron-containing alcohol dehydrogenase n=1 Tax=Paenibacillus sp. GSMTC-2017 TaxID=2794350 RepID=UPI0018D9E197|nr:iron-containing alcohol dehydrogenase [Paenibacillus sp. GSMTC-2017]MBH5318267.1 iron-containing alcohol dehydrogenase [Paenibacillus sp. GSMTC-2017]
MNNFQFHNPTRIVFGEGTISRIGELTAHYGKSILLVYGGGSIKSTGLYDLVRKQLSASNVTVHELAGIEPNPRLTTVNKGIDICRTQGIEFILAVGGGSVIDAAKAIAAGALYDGDVWDFFTGKASIKQALPIGTVLTLAATGSEMNGNTVISHWEEKLKRGAGSSHLFPTFSILDPELTYTVPRNHTVYGSVDIMSHVFEQYFSLTENTPLQERFCESILQTVIENIEPALVNPNDKAARANLMWCGTMALNGGQISLGMVNDWASHGIEHEVSAIYDIPHGAGLAVIFPNWMKYVYKERVDRFAQYATRVWGIDAAGKTEDELALAGIEATRDFFTRIGAESTLADFGIGEEQLDRMAEEAVRYSAIGSFKTLEKNDVLEILRMSL